MWLTLFLKIKMTKFEYQENEKQIFPVAVFIMNLLCKILSTSLCMGWLWCRDQNLQSYKVDSCSKIVLKNIFVFKIFSLEIIRLVLFVFL